MGGFALYLKNLVEKGYETGLEQGFGQGIEQGIEIGINKVKIDTAREMLRFNMNDEIIVAVTKLSLEEVQRIRESLVDTAN